LLSIASPWPIQVYALAKGEAVPAAEEAEMEQEFQRGMRALIVGSLSSLPG